MSQQAPPVDYKGVQGSIGNAANAQLQNNRLNTSNPFASQTFNDDGSVSSQFGFDLSRASQGLMGQAAGLGQGMDWNQFGEVGTGDQARDQAINAAYTQATSRLDPMWSQREEQTRTRLLQQGLDPDSEAAKNEMLRLGQQRNDAYSGAMSGAIQQGTAAGDSVFRNNMASRQQQVSEALQERGMPLNELRQLQALLGQQPQYGADNSTLAGALGSAPYAAKGAEQERDEFMRRQQEDSNTAAGVMSGIGTAAGIAAMFF